MSQSQLEVITSSCAKRGKACVNELRLVLTLPLIGWKIGASFFSQSCSEVSAKPIAFRHSNENRSKQGAVAPKWTWGPLIFISILRSGVPFFRGRERNAWYNYLTIRLSLVQNLDFSLIGQETRGTNRTKSWLVTCVAVWLLVTEISRADEFQMASDDANEESELLSALNASLESFVLKTLKDEQIECIRRFGCHGRDVVAVLPTGFGKSAIYQLIPKVLFQRHIKNHRCCGKSVELHPKGTGCFH